MDLFEVRRSAFEDLDDFNRHISDEEKCEISRNLHIVVGLSQYNETDLYHLFESYGFEIQDYGAIKKISKTYTKESDDSEEETEYTAEFYSYFSSDEDSVGGVILLYTNQRKTKEIEDTVKGILQKHHGLYYLHIGTNLFNQTRDEIRRRESIPEIVEFVADRSKQTDRKARIRDEVDERTVVYYGEDGWETLNEMEENYGVSPRYLVFNLPNKAVFKIARDGVFSLQEGDLSKLFSYVEFCINKSLKRKEAFSASDFEMVSTTPTLSIPTSEPATIALREKMEYDDAESIKSKMEEEEYYVVDSYEQRGSLHLSSKIYDEKRNNTFRIKANGRFLKVFPDDGDRDLGTFLRFHEFVQDYVDPDADAYVNQA